VETSSTTVSTAASSTPESESTYNVPFVLEDVRLLGSLSQMTLISTTQLGSVLYRFNYSYSVIYAAESGALTTYKVAITGPSVVYSGTGWVLSNGTVLAFEVEGYNETGDLANGAFSDDFGNFWFVALYSENFSTFFPPSQVQPTGESSVTLGSVTMNATSYEPTDSSPIVYTMFALQAGVVPGTNFTLTTVLDVVEEDSPGLDLQIVSITEA
jgi:hypothetical protein